MKNYNLFGAKPRAVEGGEVPRDDVLPSESL